MQAIAVPQGRQRRELSRSHGRERVGLFDGYLLDFPDAEAIIDRIVDQFASLPRIMAASPSELEKVGGIGGAKARSVKDGLARLVEASILERYE